MPRKGIQSADRLPMVLCIFLVISAEGKGDSCYGARISIKKLAGLSVAQYHRQFAHHSHGTAAAGHTHRGFAQQAIDGPMLRRSHDVDQSSVLVDSRKQIFHFQTNPNIGLVDLP
ncbi:hypothetical protein NKK51_30295 [Mesorhizobium sp. M0011]